MSRRILYKYKMSMGIYDNFIDNNGGFTTPRYSYNNDIEMPETPRVSRVSLIFFENNFENIHNPINQSLVRNLGLEFERDMNTISNIHEQTFSRSLPSSTNCEDDCPICLQSMSEGNIVCGTCDERHKFHAECVRNIIGNKCPMCRANW